MVRKKKCDPDLEDDLAALDSHFLIPSGAGMDEACMSTVGRKTFRVLQFCLGAPESPK